MLIDLNYLKRIHMWGLMFILRGVVMNVVAANDASRFDASSATLIVVYFFH